LIDTPFGTLATCDLSVKILRIVPGEEERGVAKYSEVHVRYLISWWVSCSINKTFSDSTLVYDKHLNDKRSMTLGEH